MQDRDSLVIESGASKRVGLLVRDPVVAMGLLVGYYFARYFKGLWALPFLILFGIALAGWVVCGLRSQSQRPLLLVLMAIYGSVGLQSLTHGEPQVATYFVFELSAFVIMLFSGRVFTSLSLPLLRFLIFVYIALVCIFFAFPIVEGSGGLGNSLAEIEGMLYVSEDTHGIKVFFYDSGEFGVFSASLFSMLVVASCSIGRGKFDILDLLSAAVLFAFVILSKADTALIVVLASLFVSLGGARRGFRPLLALLLAVMLAQALWASLIAELIGKGSVAWRFQMAALIFNNAEAVSFSPEHMALLPNWPHSIILDTVVVFGWCGVLLFALFVVAAIRAGGDRAGGFWLLFFLLCACVMPPGAGPVFCALALACVANCRLVQAS